MPDNTAVNCAKMAGPIDLLFGLWTRGRRKHNFNCIRQLAPMCSHESGSIVFAWWSQCALMLRLANTTEPSMAAM